MSTLISKEALLELQVVAAIALCLGVTLIAVACHRLASSHPPLPPGPPGYLIFGNSFPKALCVVFNSSFSLLIFPLPAPIVTLKNGHRNLAPSFP